MLCHDLSLLFKLFRCQRLCVSTCRFTGFSKVRLDKLCAERFDLLLDDRPGIKSLYRRPQAARCRNGLQPRNPNTDDE